MYEMQGSSTIMNSDETLTVTRSETPTYVDGKLVQGDTEEIEWIGNVQPLSGRDLMMVPEGDRFKEQYWLYSENLEMALEVDDMVTREGKNFTVQNLEPWGSYSRARIMILDTGPNRTP